VDEELDEVGHLVDLGVRHGVPHRGAPADAVDERRVVAVRDLALLLVEVTREERDEAPCREVGPVLADQQVGSQVTRLPPLAQRRLVGSEPVELVAEQEAFGLGVARHDPILSVRRPRPNLGGRVGGSVPRVGR